MSSSLDHRFTAGFYRDKFFTSDGGIALLDDDSTSDGMTADCLAPSDLDSCEHSTVGQCSSESHQQLQDAGHMWHVTSMQQLPVHQEQHQEDTFISRRQARNVMACFESPSVLPTGMAAQHGHPFVFPTG